MAETVLPAKAGRARKAAVAAAVVPADLAVDPGAKADQVIAARVQVAIAVETGEIAVETGEIAVKRAAIAAALALSFPKLSLRN